MPGPSASLDAIGSRSPLVPRPPATGAPGTESPEGKAVSDPRRLAEAIAQEQAQLVALRRELEASEERLVSLQALSVAESSAAGGAAEGQPTVTLLPRTAQEKIALFRNLFRGRLDVFPRRWENVHTGKSGWAPACANEWVRGVCEKPRVRCGECPSQAFLPLDDAAILGHLQGRHVLGLYPLLAETPAGSSRPISMARPGATMYPPSSRRADTSTCRQRSSGLDRATAHTSGSSSPRPWPRTRRAEWPARCSRRRWRAGTSSP